MKVKVSRFWPGFEFNGSFFASLLEEKYGEVNKVAHTEDADLELISVFPPKIEVYAGKIQKLFSGLPFENTEKALSNVGSFLPPRTTARRVWFTGENVRVPFGADFDFSLSFEQDTYGGSNVYLPLWHLDLNWRADDVFSRRVGLRFSKEQLLSPRKFEGKRTKFACAFIGNSHPMRDRLISELRKVGEVDVYGKSVGRPVEFKSVVARDYKYMLCFENDLYPGYVTEKLLEAYLSGCVPLYWGDLGVDENINRDSFINLRNFDGVEQFVTHIQGLGDDSYEAIHNEAFLKRLPSISSVRDIF